MILNFREKGYGIKRVSISLFLFFSLLCASSIFGEENSPLEVSYPDLLVEKANRLELYKDRYWHILLHYTTSIWGYKSLVDDPKFFLAKDGKKNPKSEMEAAIRAFFDGSKDNSGSAICKFVGRFNWLKEKLDIDEKKLPYLKCDKVNDFLEKMRPLSATIIFPTSHINSPASMFGHTLLIVETENKSKLLSYAINYSAVTPETFGPIFAIKGLFGLYPGYYSVLPYYAKVQEYSDFDYRDMWEYELNLTKPEIIKMMYHLFELDDIYSDYFFFDENCSYNLLFLLEAARPTLNLTNTKSVWVAPIRTLRDMYSHKLINNFIYRPSRVTKIRHIASLLTGRGQDTALKLYNEKVTPESFLNSNISRDDKIKITDLLSEYVQYKYTREDISKDEYAKKFISTLHIRSTLGNSEASEYKYPEPSEPTTGHNMNRLNMGAGIRNDEFFEEIKFRPVYHDILNLENGYVRGGQIVFGDTVLRLYNDRKKLKFERFDFIDIFSLGVRDKFIKPISWKVITGFAQKVMEDGDDNLVYQVSPGGGLAYEFFPGIFYLMTETDLNVGRALAPNYSWGVGASAGVISDIKKIWKIHLYGKYMYYLIGDAHKEMSVSLKQQFVISTNNSISLELLKAKNRDYKDEIGILSYNFFF